MSPVSDIEERLRRGLAEAAAQIPPARPVPPTPAVELRPSPPVVAPRIRFLAGLAYVAAAVLLVLSGVIVLQEDGVSDSSTEAGNDESEASVRPTTTEPPEPHVPVPANGMTAGQAVVVGTELRTFGPDGTPSGSVSLGYLDQGISTVSSDLDGGWVACGMMTNPAWQPGSTEFVRLGRLVWFPRDGQPIELATEAQTVCAVDALQVVDSAQGPTVVYRRDGFAEPSGGPFRLGAIVLATREARPIMVTAGEAGPAEWSAATGRIVTWTADGGVQLWDIVGGAPLPIAAIDVANVADLALSPDATTVAVLDGLSGYLTIHDLASGAIVFEQDVDVTAPGADISYDGTVVAVSNAGLVGPDVVEVFDVPTGARRTIDGGGVLP